MGLNRHVLLLGRADIEALITMDQCINAVEAAFLGLADTGAASAVVGVTTATGSFHVKAAELVGDARYFAAKLNANFPRNPSQHGLPTIQGLVVLSDGETGAPLAVLDSATITGLRTGAATAVAARYLALRDARTVTIVGCGAQAPWQLAALGQVRQLDRIFAFDIDREAARRLADREAARIGVPIEPVDHLPSVSRISDIVVTCTSSRRALLGPDDVRDGAFVAAVGADAESKQEIDPALLARAVIITDRTEQCAAFGDLHHALSAGIVTLTDVRAELGQVVSGRRPGRLSADERIVFDSTGTPVQDVAVAAVVFERAVALGAGQAFDFAHA